MIDTQSFSPADQRKLFSLLPTGVTAITGITEQEQPIGMIVGTFQSLSLEPALVTFCVDKSSSTWPMLRTQGKFTANILSTEQLGVCQALGRKGLDKFNGIDHKAGILGTPHIAHSVAWIDCTVISEVMAGDHFMIVGVIKAVKIGDAHAMSFSEGKLSGCVPLIAPEKQDETDMISQITNAWTRAWSNGETEAFEKIVSPDYVRYSKGGQQLKIADVVRQIQEAHEAFTNYRTEILKIVQDDDSIALHWKTTAKHTGVYMGVPPTFKEMSVNGASFMRHKNGLITQEWMVWDPSEFLTSIDIWQLSHIA